jgi:GNAT superfamily N-acetyltransferase
MRLARATADDFKTVLGLIDEAASWLRTKGTDQWLRPWPTREARDGRVKRGLGFGKTWIAWDGAVAAATVTLAAKLNPKVWSWSDPAYWPRPACTCDLGQRAVYAHRLITAASHRGQNLGAQLIDWAGWRARCDYGARWIRIDVWSTNTALHEYYKNAGFEPCGECPDPAYPSGKLFQKQTDWLGPRDSPLLSDYPQEPLFRAEGRSGAGASKEPALA